MVHILTSGTTTISYTVANSCGTVAATLIVTVNASSVSAIAGTATVCGGSTTALTDATPGGAWSSTNTVVATISTSGVVHGLTSGTTTISYTVTSGGVTVAATQVVTVNPSPVAGTIGGVATVCTSSSITLTDAATGGVWSSTNTVVATVGTSGAVHGLTSGTATISYTVTNGCGTVAATVVVTVTSLPPAGTVSGPATLVAGTTTTLTDGAPGGVWSSSNTAVATVSASGVVHGLTSGTSTISYTAANSCGTVAATRIVTVNPATIGSISGTATVCAGSTTTLTDATCGGVWSSTNTAVATVSASGVVHGITSGTTTISYTITSGGVSVAAMLVVTVNPIPAPICGTFSVCGTAMTTLTDASPGGHWGSCFTAVATVGSGTGTVKGVTTGTTTITYTLTATGCSTTHTFTVNAGPAAIGGDDKVCAGSTISLADCTPGGTWISSAATVATICSTTGILTGIATGVSTITYRLASGCYITTPVTVNPVPAAISGATTVAAGATVTLADATVGGTWSSGSMGIATVVPTSGVVHGVADGTATIFYTLCTGCRMSKTITVGSCRNGEKPSNVETISTNSDIQVLPNPNKGIFTIKGTLSTTDDEEVSINVVDLFGRVIYSRMIIAQKGEINERIQLNGSIANGMYLVNLRSATDNNVFHIVIVQKF